MTGRGNPAPLPFLEEHPRFRDRNRLLRNWALVDTEAANAWWKGNRQPTKDDAVVGLWRLVHRAEPLLGLSW